LNDIGNRTNYRHTVLDLLSDVHGKTMAAMNYNLIYGAWNGYGQDGSGVDYHQGLWWATNCTNQANITLSSGLQATNIYMFNPGDTGWQSYILSRENDVFAAYPFDGWQADQLGDQGTTYDCNGNLVNVPNTFSGFITAAASQLHKSIVFNAVGQYGQQQVAANANLPFLYTECWPANGPTSYNDLQTTVNNNTTWSSGKKTVLAAYLDQAYGQGFSDTAPGFFSDPGVLLTEATVFASGGDHIDLGDVDHMLTQPYYPNEHLLMDSSLQQAVRSDYDFMVAYENLLRDGLSTSTNVVSIPGVSTSTNGSAGTVWTFVRSKTGTDVLHFINLLNSTSTSWMDTNANTPAPPLKKNVSVKYYYGTGTPSAVKFASPDLNGGSAQSLSFTTGTDAGGSYVQFTLPSLDYWDMVWVSK
jgi:dextranase